MKHWIELWLVLTTHARSDGERERKAADVQRLATAFCRFMVDWKARAGMNYYMHFLHAHVADQIREFKCADIFDLSGSGLEQLNQVLKRMLRHHSNRTNRVQAIAKKQKRGANHTDGEVVRDHHLQVMTRLRCHRLCQGAEIEAVRMANQVRHHTQQAQFQMQHVMARQSQQNDTLFERKKAYYSTKGLNARLRQLQDPFITLNDHPDAI